MDGSWNNKRSWRSSFTSEVYEPVLPGRQHHGQSRPLHVGQSSQLRVRHSGGLRVPEHADLPLVEHHLQGSQSGSDQDIPNPSTDGPGGVGSQQIYQAVSWRSPPA